MTDVVTWDPTVIEAAVSVYCDDAITRAGICSLLPESVVEVAGGDPSATSAVVAVEIVDEPALEMIRRARGARELDVVLIVTALDETSLVAAFDAGVRTILTRAEITSDRLLQAIQAAASDQTYLPTAVVRDVFGRVAGRGQAKGNWSGSKPTARECSVLELIADGMSTSDVARNLSYSERTIKGVLQTITNRVQARNRTHAVSIALRQGWI